MELIILSYAYFLTGDIKYLRRAVWLSDRFIDGSAVDKQGDSMDGRYLGGISMASYFLTRALILMAALKQHGSKDLSKGGRPPFNRLTLFKALVILSLFNLL